MRKTDGFTLIELMIVIAIIAIIAAVAIPSLMKSRLTANEQNAAMTLATIKNAQAAWREADMDGNAYKDYWTLDLAGMYGTPDGSGDPIAAIGIGLAKADDGVGQPYAVLPNVGIARAGFLFQVMDQNVDGNAYQLDVDGDGNAFTNLYEFGYCCYPQTYGVSGIRTYILDQSGELFGIDQAGAQQGQWPAEDPTTAGWTREGV